MVLKNIFKLAMVSILFTSLYAGELKVRNNATTAIEVTVRAKENKTAGNPFTVIQRVDPGKEITIALDEKEFKGTTFSIIGTTIVPPPAIPLVSNECILSGCEGKVEFVSKGDDAIVCGVIEIR